MDILENFQKWYLYHFAIKLFIFMPPPTKWPEALCFQVVRPFVRPYVGTSVPFCLCRYLKNRVVVLHQTWYEGISWGDDTLYGF